MSENLRLADIEGRKRRLPHLEMRGAVYFVTYRVADSLPRSLLEEWEAELAAAGLAGARLGRERIRRIETALDAGRGSCPMARSEVAEVVVESLKHFDRERYTLFAWCVMPNHVHIVIRPRPGMSLAHIIRSWKTYTARRANEILGRSGRFWQREYFDRIIRDAAHMGRAVRYVRDNPSRAGLEDWPWVWIREDLKDW